MFLKRPLCYVKKCKTFGVVLPFVGVPRLDVCFAILKCELVVLLPNDYGSGLCRILF